MEATLDLRRAFRALRQNLSLTVVATLSLGLGIGVNATLYSVFRAIFLQPPTAADPERLVRIEPGNGNQISYPNFSDLQPSAQAPELAAYAMTGLNLRSGDSVERIRGMVVASNFFETLGVAPALGRTFAQQEEPAAILTHDFWQRRLGGSTDPLGVQVYFNDRPYTVIGVLAEGYRPITGAIGPEAYLQIHESLAPAKNQRSQQFLTMIGRLGENATAEHARAALTSQLGVIESIYPEENAGLGQPAHVFPVTGLASWRTRDVPMASLVGLSFVPFAIFGLVLLIACGNVAALLLARGAARGREIAVRLALGATRRRVVQALLGESLLLSMMGAFVGLLLAYWLCGAIRLIPLPGVGEPLVVSPDFTLLLYAFCLAVFAALACGLTPALASSKPQLVDALRRETAPKMRRLSGRSTLVIGQVALSTLLLFLSTLFLRSLAFISATDPGFNMDRVFTAHVDLDRQRYPEEQRRAFSMRALEAVRSLPGVESASVANVIPLGGDVYSTSYEVEGMATTRTETHFMHVGEDYFRTMEIPLRLGREFAVADGAGAAPVAIVNETFVRMHSIDQTPLGVRVRSSAAEPWMQIVGVVADSKYAFFGETPRPILYRSYLQTGGSLFVVVRASGTAATVIPAIRRTLLDLDGSVLVEAKTIRDATSLELSMRCLGGWLLGAVGVLGVALALIGLYGLLSYMVCRRTPEIGVRMALGASQPAISRMVLRSGLGLALAGLGVGTILALVVTRPLEILTSGVSGSDPATIAIPAALLLAAGAAASYVPSRKAARVDPMSLLRSE